MAERYEFVVTGPAVTSKPVPAKFNDIVFPSESASVATREFTFDRSNGMWTINGLSWVGKRCATCRPDSSSRPAPPPAHDRHGLG
jgi:hypothetical protein